MEAKSLCQDEYRVIAIESNVMVQAGRQYNKKSSGRLIDIMGLLQRGLLFFHKSLFVAEFLPMCPNVPKEAIELFVPIIPSLWAFRPWKRVTFSLSLSFFFIFS